MTDAKNTQNEVKPVESNTYETIPTQEAAPQDKRAPWVTPKLSKLQANYAESASAGAVDGGATLS